jgi:threonine synthase
MRSALSHLECSKCGASYDADVQQHLCVCGAPLLARYDLKAAAATCTRSSLAQREENLWRYSELLPVREPAKRVTLHESFSPIIPLQTLNRDFGFKGLAVKDEGTLPTGSFKARGAAVGISRASELGVEAFAMPTNGNAGAAWAAYAARAGIRAHIVMPTDAPLISRLECFIAGADVQLVNGLINDAASVVNEAVAHHGWYDASTLKEPYRIEGKKTLGFEIVEQFAWDLPDVIVYPTGGGVGLIGMYKAFLELREIGLLGERMPRFVAVQAQGCRPIVDAWRDGKRESMLQRGSNTVAFGINVPKALGDFLVLDILYATGGAAVAIGDEAMLEMQQLIGSREGVFVCPEGAATLAAAIMLRRDGWITDAQRVLLINTGTGLKYADIPYPQPAIIERK